MSPWPKFRSICTFYRPKFLRWQISSLQHSCRNMAFYTCFIFNYSLSYNFVKQVRQVQNKSIKSLNESISWIKPKKFLCIDGRIFNDEFCHWCIWIIKFRIFQLSVFWWWLLWTWRTFLLLSIKNFRQTGLQWILTTSIYCLKPTTTIMICDNYYFRIENQIFEIKIRKVGFIVLVKHTLYNCKSEFFKLIEYLIQFFLVLRIRSFELPKGHLRHFK